MSAPTTHRDLCKQAQEILTDYLSCTNFEPGPTLEKLVALFDGPRQREADANASEVLGFNEYQTLARRTLATPGAQHWFTGPEVPPWTVARRDFENRADLLHAALGVAGEAGELVDPIKKAVFYGKPLGPDEIENIKEEAGDLLWYIAGPFCRALNCSFAELGLRNAAKLKKRYPDKYTDAAAIERADKVEESAPLKPVPPAGFEKMKLRELTQAQKNEIRAKYPARGDVVDFGDGYVWSTAESCWQICPECWEPLTA